jgi:outer membrane protein assembly factor BamB
MISLFRYKPRRTAGGRRRFPLRVARIAAGIIALAFCTCNGQGPEKSNKQEDTLMALEITGVAYPVRFADFQRNSFVPIELKPKWQPVWSRAYEKIDEELILAPYAVLIGGGYIGVVSESELLLFTSDGDFVKLISRGLQTPVVFGRRAMAYIDPSLIINYEGYDGSVIRDDGTVPELGEWAQSILFKPGLGEMLGVIQFTGGPRRKPVKFFAWRFNLEDEGFAWDHEYDGTVRQAVLSADNKKLVLISGALVDVLSAESGETISQFELDSANVVTASLSGSDNLVMLCEGAGENAQGYMLRSYSLSGEKQWEAMLAAPQDIQPPACGSDGRVYIVDSMQLVCVQNGERSWSAPLKSAEPTWLTVTKDNSVIAVNGALLCYFSPTGEKKFERLITDRAETFEAPAAVDGAGRIYVASNENLYCFE